MGYFYFSFNDLKKQDTPAMLRSLIKQLCLQRCDTHESVKILMTKYRDMDRDPPIAILEHTVTDVMKDFVATFKVNWCARWVPDWQARDISRQSLSHSKYYTWQCSFSVYESKRKGYWRCFWLSLGWAFESCYWSVSSSTRGWCWYWFTHNPRIIQSEV